MLLPPLDHQDVVTGIAHAVGDPVYAASQVPDHHLLAGTALPQYAHQEHVATRLAAVHGELVALHQADMGEAQATALYSAGIRVRDGH